MEAAQKRGFILHINKTHLRGEDKCSCGWKLPPTKKSKAWTNHKRWLVQNLVRGSLLFAPAMPSAPSGVRFTSSTSMPATEGGVPSERRAVEGGATAVQSTLPFDPRSTTCMLPSTPTNSSMVLPAPSLLQASIPSPMLSGCTPSASTSSSVPSEPLESIPAESIPSTAPLAPERPPSPFMADVSAQLHRIKQLTKLEDNSAPKSHVQEELNKLHGRLAAELPHAVENPERFSALGALAEVNLQLNHISSSEGDEAPHSPTMRAIIMDNEENREQENAPAIRPTKRKKTCPSSTVGEGRICCGYTGTPALRQFAVDWWGKGGIIGNKRKRLGFVLYVDNLPRQIVSNDCEGNRLAQYPPQSYCCHPCAKLGESVRRAKRNYDRTEEQGKAHRFRHCPRSARDYMRKTQDALSNLKAKLQTMKPPASSTT
ncbi:hypothetical protein QOT17_004669 [Balamuthia mandrillaris]